LVILNDLSPKDENPKKENNKIENLLGDIKVIINGKNGAIISEICDVLNKYE